MKCWIGWVTNWNQDCWERCQQPQICRWYHSNGRKWRGTKEPLDECEKASLQLNVQKLRSWHLALSLMASRKWKSRRSDKFSFLGLQITEAGDCSHEIRRRLLLGKKAMANLDGVLKSRERYHFAGKCPYSQSSIGLSSSHVWMWELGR